MKQANHWSDKEKEAVVAFLTEVFKDHAFISPDQIKDIFYQSIYLDGETYLADFEEGQVTAIAAMIVEAIERDGIVYFNACYCREGKEARLQAMMHELEKSAALWGANVSKVGLRKENSQLGKTLLPDMDYKETYRILEMKKTVNPNKDLPEGFERRLVDGSSLARFVDLHNQAFAGGPNASTMLMGEAEEGLARQGAGETKMGFLCYENEPVGTYFLSMEKDVLWVDAVTVNPEHQGKGWGKLVIQAAEEDAMASEIHLLVVDSNLPAFHLYQSTGFVEEKVYSEWFEKDLKK
jgi:ribosomal protein S18 acetylase RimI-like enzyme